MGDGRERGRGEDWKRMRLKRIEKERAFITRVGGEVDDVQTIV